MATLTSGWTAGCTTTDGGSWWRPQPGGSVLRYLDTQPRSGGLPGLAIGGGADAMSGVFRNTMWNQSIPRRPRTDGRHRDDLVLGRSDGWTVRAGLMAAWTTCASHFTFGGLACTGSVGPSRRRCQDYGL